jgi:hypothetical protein
MGWTPEQLRSISTYDYAAIGVMLQEDAAERERERNR